MTSLPDFGTPAGGYLPQTPPLASVPFRPVRSLGFSALGTASAATLCLVGIYLPPADAIPESIEPIFYALTAMAFLMQLATYILLSLWQVAVKRNLELQHLPTPPTWKIWAGWFIPFANLVFPVQVMAQLNARRTVPSWWLGVWWVSWIATGFGDRLYLIATDPGVTRALDLILATSVVCALASLIVVVRGITEGHTAPAPTPTDLAVGSDRHT